MINLLLKELGFDYLQQDEREKLLGYTAGLMDQLATGEFGTPPKDLKILNVFAEFATEQPVSDKHISGILENIQKRQELDVSLVPAMLASLPMDEYIDRDHYRRIKAWTLLACIGLIQSGGHQSAAEEAARRVRLMLLEKYRWMLEQFPNFNNGLDTIVMELDGLKSVYRSAEIGGESCVDNNDEKRRAALISQILIVLKDYQKHTGSRNRKKNKFKPEKRRMIRSIEIAPAPGLEDEDYSYNEISEKPVVDVFTVAEEELEADQSQSHKYIVGKVKTSEGTKTSAVLKAHQAKTMANRLVMRGMQHPCEWGDLTRYEMTVLLQHCWEGLNSENLTGLVLLLMLLTGRPYERIIRLLASKNTDGEKLVFNNNRVGLAYTPQLPQHHLNGKAAQLLTTHKMTVYFMLPDKFFHVLTAVMENFSPDLEVIKVSLQERMSIINKKFGTRLTVSRISAYLHASLGRTLDDPADAALVCGYSAQQCTPLYYYAPEAQSLADIYREKTLEMFTQADICCDLEKANPQDSLIGSRLIVDEKLVAVLFRKLQKRLKNMRENPLTDSMSFHNEYVIYVYQLLTLATGHRPVSAPYEVIDDFDLNRGVLWISDKEVRSGLAARSIPLADIVIEQVRLYITHLKALRIELWLDSPKHAPYIEAVLEGDNFQEMNCYFLPWFDGHRFVPLRPLILAETLSDKWPLPLNWQRHAMRNALKAEGISGDCINAWMGHDEFGEEVSGPWSSMSHAEIMSLAEAVQNILHRLNVEPASGWVQKK